MNFEKLEKCYEGQCDYKENDCLQAAAKFVGEVIPYEYDSPYAALRHIVKLGGMEAAMNKHGWFQVDRLAAKRGDGILRSKYTIGIYCGGGIGRFFNGYFPLEKDDKLFRKDPSYIMEGLK